MLRPHLIVASCLACFSSVTSVRSDAAGLVSASALVAPQTKPFDGSKLAARSRWTNAGFALPVAVTKANEQSMGAWSEVGDADWSCLGTPRADQPSTQAIALSGTIDDWQNGARIGNAVVVAFPGNLVTGNLGSATSSNVVASRGQYVLTVAELAAGTTRVGFRIEVSGYLRTYVVDEYFEPTVSTQTRSLSVFAESTANALPAFVGVSRDAADGMFVGTMHDCAGREVSNAIATVSSISAAARHLDGADTFYFSAGSSSLPVRRSTSPSTNDDGMFLVLGLPPRSMAFVQVWGFTSNAKLAMGAAGLQLLAELPVPIEANAVFTASLSPPRI